MNLSAHPQRATIACSAALALAVLLLAHQSLQLADSSMFGLALNNAAHTPFFVVLTLLAHVLGFAVTPLRLLRKPLPMFLTMAAVGAGTELLQLFTGRSASLEDWGRDLLGVVAALCFIQVLVPRPSAARLPRAGLAMLGAVLVALGFAGVAAVVALHHQRDELVPQLLPLDADLLAASARIRGTWHIAGSPSGIGPYLRLELDDSRFPGLTLREPFPDWRNYNWLVVDGRTAAGRELPLMLRVETFSDRGMGYMREVILTGERQEHRLPLHALAADRGSIRNLFLYAEQGRPGDEIILHGIRLE